MSNFGIKRATCEGTEECLMSIFLLLNSSKRIQIVSTEWEDSWQTQKGHENFDIMATIPDFFLFWLM